MANTVGVERETEESMTDYLERMSGDSQHAGEPELAATAAIYRRPVNVYSARNLQRPIAYGSNYIVNPIQLFHTQLSGNIGHYDAIEKFGDVLGIKGTVMRRFLKANKPSKQVKGQPNLKNFFSVSFFFYINYNSITITRSK